MDGRNRTRTALALVAGVVLLSIANPVVPARDAWAPVTPVDASRMVDEEVHARVHARAAAPVADALAAEARLAAVVANGRDLLTNAPLPDARAWFFVNGAWSPTWFREAPYAADLDGDGNEDHVLRATMAAGAGLCLTVDALPGLVVRLLGGSTDATPPAMVGAYHDGRFVLVNTTAFPERHARACVSEGLTGDVTLASQAVPEESAAFEALAVTPGALVYASHAVTPATASLRVSHGDDGTVLADHAGRDLDLAVAAFASGDAFLASFPNGSDGARVGMTPAGPAGPAAFAFTGDPGGDVVAVHVARDTTFAFARAAPESVRATLAPEASHVSMTLDASARVPEALLAVLHEGSRTNYTLALARDAPTALDAAIAHAPVSTGAPAFVFELDADARAPEVVLVTARGDALAAMLARDAPSRVRHASALTVTDGTVDPFRLDVQADGVTGELLAYARDAGGSFATFTGAAPGDVAFRAAFRDPTGVKPTPDISLASSARTPSLWAFANGSVLHGGVAFVMLEDAPPRFTTTFPALDVTDAGRVRYATDGTGTAGTTLAVAELPRFLADAPARNLTLYALNVTDLDLQQKRATDTACPGCQYWPTRGVGTFVLRHPALMVGGADVAAPSATWRVDECGTRWGPPAGGDACDGVRASWMPVYTSPWAGYAVHVPSALTPGAPVRAVPVVT